MELSFNVQADRITPGKGATTSWVAVKISARAKDPPDGEAAKLAERPWRWLDSTGAAWTPHSKDSWQVWKITPKEDGSFAVETADIVGVKSSEVARPGLIDALDAALDEILTPEAALPTGLRDLSRPAEEDLQGTTTGYVERLALVPHPVPSSARIHALLELELVDENVCFVVSPKVHISGLGGFDGGAVQPTESPDQPGVPPGDLSLYFQQAVPGFRTSLVRTAQREKATDPDAPIDIIAQAVAINPDPAQMPASADALAELPHKLAEAIDPLARLRSVLEPVTRRWLHADGKDDVAALRLAALRADVRLDGEKRLKGFLDLVAMQVLGPRFDLQGRYETPLFAALDQALADGKETVGATKRLKRAHFEALPGVLPIAPGNGVMGVVGVIDAAVRFDVNAARRPASPFTSGYLLHLAGTAGDEDEPTLGDDAEILKAWWYDPGRASPDPAHLVRYLELPPLSDPTGPLLLSFELQESGVNAPGAEGIGYDQGLEGIDFRKTREAAALTFAAPFIEGLVSGLVNWHDQAAPRKGKLGLSQRFEISTRALLGGADGRPGLFATWQAAALLRGGAPLAPSPELDGLVAELVEAAVDEAARIARGLSNAVAPMDRVTAQTLPFVIAVDQIRTFPRGVDWWARLAGYGLLVRRLGYLDRMGALKTETATHFVSLNPASLRIGLTAIDGEGPDGQRSFVDPHAYAPGDQIGITDAIAELGNQWAGASMPGAKVLDDPLANPDKAKHARISYGPPPVKASGAERVAQIPALSFGYAYGAIGHLVTLGGILAPALRDDHSPYVMRALGDSLKLPETRFGNYLRTRGVGLPTFRVARSALLEGIALLADELPRRLAPRSVRTPVRANYDPNSGQALVGWAGDGAQGLRFELVLDNPATTSQRLTIKLWDAGGEIAIDVPAQTSGYWAAIEVRKGEPVGDGFEQCPVSLQTRAVGTGAEDELHVAWSDPTHIASHEFGGEGVYLSLCSDSEDLRVEYVGAVPFAAGLQASAVAPGVDGAAATGAPRRPAQDAERQSAVLLDGLGDYSNGLCPKAVDLRIQAPSTDRYTWERWINSALFSPKAPAGMKEKVRDWLTKVQSDPPPSEGKPGRDKPDPAIGALWIELWETYPERKRIGVGCEVLNPYSLTLGELALRVKIGTGTPLVKETTRWLATCVPGHVYELRASAAIDPDAAPFDGLRPNLERLGPGLAELLRSEKDAGKVWLLAATSVLPIEVATAEMPQPQTVKGERVEWKGATFLREIDDAGKRSVELILGSRIFGPDGRIPLRYCSTVRLAPQRWSWRGLPMSTDTSLAWIERSDDDVGAAATGSLRAAHGFGQDTKSSIAKTKQAIVVRELDWRGGWNLWRFGVHFVSRYTKLHRDTLRATLDLVRAPGYGWLDFPVADKDNGRAVAKPAPILVIPLTEADEDRTGLVPPLLALFAGTMFENDHFGDGIAVAMEMVRHPAPKPGEQTYLPQTGPDPIRSNKPHCGEPVPLRIEGPIGYGFDRTYGATRFNTYGCIVTPQSQAIVPWSMLMLKFRRLEEGGAVTVHPIALPEATLGAADPPARYPLSGVREPHPDDPRDLGTVRYDGLVFAMSIAPKGAKQTLSFHLAHGDKLPGRGMQLTIERQDELVILADSLAPDGVLQPAGTIKLALKYGKPALLRAIVSSSPKPQSGERWKPSADVMVQLLDQPTDAWLTLFALPIDLGSEELPIDQDAHLAPKYEPAEAAKPPVTVRASAFTSPVWCQVTVASSRVRLDDRAEAVDVRDLILVWNRARDGATLTLQDKAGKTVKLLPEWTAPGLEELRIAMLMRRKWDIAGRPIETPIGAFVLDDMAATKARQLWWNENDDATGARLGDVGRWRLIRLTVRKDQLNRDDFMLKDLLAEALDSAPAQPDDAPGAMTSVSYPSVWQKS